MQLYASVLTHPYLVSDTMTNRADPNQMLQNAASDQSLCCLHKQNGYVSLEENKNNENEVW